MPELSGTRNKDAQSHVPTKQDMGLYPSSEIGCVTHEDIGRSEDKADEDMHMVTAMVSQ